MTTVIAMTVGHESTMLPGKAYGIAMKREKRKEMTACQLTTNNTVKNWWAEGDTPVHADSQVTYLVDAHSTFLMMCRQFLMARQYIYMAVWGVTPLMELVRGTDQRAGPDGSPEQEALLAELRAEGLQQPEIDFWCSHDLTLQAVLGYMVSKGVEVKVLIWGSPEHFSHDDPKKAHEQLTQVGVSCILDDSAKGCCITLSSPYIKKSRSWMAPMPSSAALIC